MNILKCLFRFLLFSFIQLSTNLAQIPNASFEEWESGWSYPSPVGWFANHSLSFATVIQSSDAHTGASAAQGRHGLARSLRKYPILTSSFSVDTKPNSLTGYYKFSPANNDTLIMLSELYNQGKNIATASLYITDSSNTYNLFVVGYNYTSNEIPDSCDITFKTSFVEISSGPKTHFLIDDLAFSDVPVLSVEEDVIESYKLFQNYPNPFNLSTVIEYTIPHDSFVKLKVFDLLGREVSVLVDGNKTSGVYEVSFSGDALSSGVYIYILQSESFTQTRKFVLLK